MLLYVMRHGETKWNHLGKIQGMADIPLDQAGIDLAVATGKALKEGPFDLCFSSPLLRARQTAEAVLAGRDVPVILDARIQEINFGVLEGMVCRNEEGRLTSPEFRTLFEHPCQYQRPENGENILDVLKRTADFWEEKTKDPALADKTVLISSHGCAVRGLLQNIWHDSDNFWHGCVPPNCGITLVEVKNGYARILEQDKVFA